MIDSDALSAYSARSASLIEETPQMDEQNTKRKIIEPLLELLGWDILSSDIELEYSVRMGTGTKKVDYALKLSDTPVVFVEAKGCDTTLNGDHEEQLSSYMRQVGVDWGLLTNGSKFELYRRDRDSDRPNEISLAQFSIETIDDHQHALRAIAKESIATGESQHIAETMQAVQHAIRQLRTGKETVAEEVTAVVTTTAGEAVSQHVEDEAKAFVDALIDRLESQASTTDRGAGSSRTEPSSSESKAAGASHGAYVIEVTDDSQCIEVVSGDTQAEAIAALVEYLIDAHDLLDAIELPYVPGTGRGSRALLNDEPVHIDEAEMLQYQALDGGVYLFTSLSAADKQRYVSELPQIVGLDCTFTKGW
ncbi:type I restriction enzyme HsdR N-terminal domain-containing protein [Halobaculum roseum]|uniref:Type I restriction enzyme HsdR N-terminal domain-containing protein n=1 Tax=Halobaculum roseum TaxID=2175149 RepID=A0ABD5MR59_9EURY|nr:type I restriction enzyme HsdR N-terminal domain-containing protein [Halobaculum roseum]QZY04231.1 type I restriction enzyme HsdR N-terminal domain-containing protein [Halobaculum roseum]